MVRVWGGCAFQGKVEGAKERRIKLFAIVQPKNKKKGGEREGVKYATTTSFCVQRKKMYSEPVTNIYSTSSIE